MNVEKKKKKNKPNMLYLHMKKLNNEFDSDFHVFLQQKFFCTNKI